MNSSIALTLKCLVLSGLIIAGCTIVETIDFNFDFSGTRTVEFQYRELSEDGNKSDEDNSIPHGFRYIDSISHWVENVSNFTIDTSDYEMAKLTYDFNAKGLKIKNHERYNYFIKKMPEELGWYFKERPNTFKVINDNKVLWRAVMKNIDTLGFEELKKNVTYYDGVSAVTTINFDRIIKDIHPKPSDVHISLDRKSMTTEWQISDVYDLKRPNEVVITFE